MQLNNDPRIPEGEYSALVKAIDPPVLSSTGLWRSRINLILLGLPDHIRDFAVATVHGDRFAMFMLWDAQDYWRGTPVSVRVTHGSIHDQIYTHTEIVSFEEEYAEPCYDGEYEP